MWTEILGLERSWWGDVFGSGLSNKSFNGLSIDSNWLAVYLDQGWFGIAIDAALLLLLIFLAVTHQRGIRRALALFLVAYCLVASITETGLGDASPYLLELVVAASLLAAPAGAEDDDEDPHRPQPLSADGPQWRGRGRRSRVGRALRSRPRGRPVPAAQRGNRDWSPLRRATLPVRVLWSQDSRRSIADLLDQFAPEIVHIHNIFPLVTPSILYACRDAGVPVVATMHNYKLGCASGTLFPRWPGLPRLPRWILLSRAEPMAATAARP